MSFFLWSYYALKFSVSLKQRFSTYLFIYLSRGDSVLCYSVHLVELQGTGELYAMKAMEKSAMLNRNKVWICKRFLLTSHQLLKNENQLIDIFSGNTTCFFIFQIFMSN